MYVVLGICCVLFALLVRQTAYGCFRAQSTISNQESIAKEHWKSYAIALEVLCECCADGDLAGADQALVIIQSERETLRLLGEYDD